VTTEQPEQCPVCDQPYAERERRDSATTLDVPTHSRVCIQRYGTKFDVYLHEKITIELRQPGSEDPVQEVPRE